MRPSNALRRALTTAVLLVPVTLYSTAAQQTGRIEGTVVAATTRHPVAGAMVTIQGTNFGSVTNESGHYQIVNVSPGPHAVTVRFIGYALGRQNATVEEGQTATVDFSLTESAVTLDEVVVTGSAAKVKERGGQQHRVDRAARQ